MKIISIGIAAFLSAATSSTCASDSLRSNETTLCYPHEDVYFSCDTGNKIISVCASGNIKSSRGYVQYRAGQPSEIELEYPKNPYPPKGIFSISEIIGGNFNGVHLKFKSGRYNYIIYQSSVSGVYVKKDGKIVSNLICRGGEYLDIAPRAKRGIDLVDPIENID
ncbi:hypothetical protein [Ralstonia flaminis]|jgi:hypothetical protein|uniref:hypothetical protein n=1 Tax=Ralstonia flaminis TaxID=3058597 RepID=UPI00292D7879|nr:hypothetical protein [Ralstonia sp. LMG 18101]